MNIHVITSSKQLEVVAILIVSYRIVSYLVSEAPEAGVPFL